MFILLACEKIYVYVKGGRNFLSLFILFLKHIYFKFFWSVLIIDGSFFFWQFGSFNNNKNKYLKYFKKKKRRRINNLK